MTIYTKGHPDVIQYIDTVIHEYVHHLKIDGKGTKIKEYYRYFKEIGYDNHPHEIECCSITQKNRDKCWRDIRTQIIS